MNGHRETLTIVNAEKTLDGNLRVVFSDRTCCLVTLAELLSVGVFRAESVPSKPFLVPGGPNRFEPFDEAQAQ